MKTLILMLLNLTLGTATFYSDFYIGHRTASGQIFDQNKLTGASMTLPLGSCVQVRNIYNKKKVNVRINDRGMFNSNWIDLSKSAFMQIGNLSSGKLKVQITLLERSACR